MFSCNWSKTHGFILNFQFLNFCYFLITSYYSQCFDFKSELSELYKTEHFLKNHKTTSVSVFQLYAFTNEPYFCEQTSNEQTLFKLSHMRHILVSRPLISRPYLKYLDCSHISVSRPLLSKPNLNFYTYDSNSLTNVMVFP